MPQGIPSAKVIAELGALIQACPVEIRADYIELSLCMLIALMRGAVGDEYVSGFLKSALADLDGPSVTYQLSRH